VLLTPPHHWNTLVRPEEDNDIEEHECSGVNGALGATNHD
jgi:hypothetical protein